MTRRSSFYAVWLGLCLAALCAPCCLAAPGTFPFVIPWDDAGRTVTDVSALNPAPLDASRRVVLKDGHFADLTGRRVRLLGTNFTFSANFPDKADAPKVAARMHKLGFNCVRMHHMDMQKAPNGIFDPRFPDMQHLDPDQLDRMDWLIFQFKRHGIYVDLNLHVSRQFTQADGFPDTDRLPELGKVTAYFVPRMVELQKQYARDLLAHVNPYTKTRYADEPTIALIELNNEDTLLGAAWGATLDGLPPFCRDELARQWHDFLVRKYAATDALRRAWGGGKPLGGSILANGSFTQGTSGWTLEMNQPPARAAMDAEQAAGATVEGQALHVRVQQLGAANWHLQLHQTGLDLKEGESYTVQFTARADRPRTLPVYTGLDKDPWRHVGLERTVRLTTEWQRYALVFTASTPEKAHNRLSFVLGDALGDVWLADVSLRPGIADLLAPGQSVEARNVPLPDSPSATPQGRDYVAFLMDVEDRYAQGMRAYIKGTLGSKALVTCSQASYGGLGGAWRESRMDYVDMHAYWQHPSFPGRPWDAKDWYIPNTPMVADPNGGTLPGLAMYRVAGKPFTVSEYNHPAPNRYRAEGLPMLAAYAAWQDWDGIFLFDYNGDRRAWKRDAIKGFFSVDTDPARTALMPAAAMLFLRGDVRYSIPGGGDTLVVPEGQVVPLTARYGGTLPAGWPERAATVLCSRLSIRFVKGGGAARIVSEDEPLTRPGGAKPGSRRGGAAGLRPAREPQMQPGHQWDAVGWIKGSAGAPQVTFWGQSRRSTVLVGYPGTTPYRMDLGGDEGVLTVTVSKTGPSFAVLALTALDGRDVRRSHSLLLTAVGDVQNNGMGWNAARTSVGDQWGSGPTMAEGIAATVTLKTDARAARVYALDGTGRRVRAVPATVKGGRLAVRIVPDYRTLWYEIAAP